MEKIFAADTLLFMARSAGWSIIIAVCALLAGTVLGILAAAARISKSKILRAISTVYVEFIRGTPMLVQILFWFLGFPVVCKAITGSAVNIDPYAIGIIAMGINSGAYSCELIRSAIMAVDRGQWEAAQSLGLTLVDGGHYATEAPVLTKLQEKLQEAFPGVEVLLAQAGKDPAKTL